MQSGIWCAISMWFFGGYAVIWFYLQTHIWTCHCDILIFNPCVCSMTWKVDKNGIIPITHPTHAPQYMHPYQHYPHPPQLSTCLALLYLHMPHLLKWCKGIRIMDVNPIMVYHTVNQERSDSAVHRGDAWSATGVRPIEGIIVARAADTALSITQGHISTCSGRPWRRGGRTCCSTYCTLSITCTSDLGIKHNHVHVFI